MAYVTKLGSRYQLVIADADGESARVALKPRVHHLCRRGPQMGASWLRQPSGKATVRVGHPKNRPTPLADGKGTNSAPAWSPTASNWRSASRAGRQLFPDQPTAVSRRLTQTSKIDTEAVFTPDGRQIYFVSDRGGGPQVYRMPSGGGSAERVTFTGTTTSARPSA